MPFLVQPDFGVDHDGIVADVRAAAAAGWREDLAHQLSLRVKPVGCWWLCVRHAEHQRTYAGENAMHFRSTCR